MKIESLTLERYGIFTDRMLSFRPDASLHVVLGANEAGKTSALSAIGDLLFGFGHQTAYDFRHDSKALRIGGVLRHSDGRMLAVRRRKGTRNTLVDDDDQPVPDENLTPFLGGVTRDVFGREFGLTAQALREGGNDLLRAGGSLAETLAAGSAGLTALSRLRERLKGEADELFTPRKSASKPFYVAADRHDAAERALRDAVVTREALEQSEKTALEARQRLDTLNADHAAAGRNLARWQRTLRVRSKLTRLQTLAQEIESLADLPEISAQTLAEWRAVLQADATLTQELRALDAADAADAASIAALAVDERLVSAGPVIDALRERLGAVRKAIDDLPRRREARRQAQDALDTLAYRLGLPSHAALLAQLPTDPALARVRDLIERFKRAEQSRRDADDKRLRAQREIDSFKSDEAVVSAIADPEPLRQRFDALGDIPTLADRLRRDVAALDQETKSLAAAASALDPAPGSVGTLSALPMPDHQTMTAQARLFESLDHERRRLDDLQAAADGAIDAAEVNLSRLVSDGVVATKADLFEARQQRDGSLQRLRDALDGDPSARAARLADLEVRSRAIDNTTDRLLMDVDRAARREAAKEGLSLSRKERDKVLAALADVTARRAEAERAWQALWTASGIVARSPAEMLRWRERLEAIVARHAKLGAQQSDIDALSASQEANKLGVAALLEGMGRTPDCALPPDVLYREARSRLDELQKGWADTRARAVARQRADRDLVEAQAALDQATRVLAELKGVWPTVLASLQLPNDASPAEAEAALTVWQAVPLPKLNWESEGHRVATIEADLVAFDRDVSDVASQVTPDIAGADAQQVLARLLDRLQEARRAADACQRLCLAAERRAGERAVLALKRSSLEAALQEVCRTLGVADSAKLADPLDRLTALHAKQQERAMLQRDLSEVADGLDEAALWLEQDGLDLDALPGEIERVTIRQKQLLSEISDASAQLHQRERELEALTKGRDANAAATERAEAGAELRDVAERWILRMAAARLASLAIERHRGMVQDPLVTRAGSLFSLATGGAFQGLAIDYGNDDQPIIVAARAGGERIDITGLSEGTRDQLFLALRLALLERRGGEALPFIGDDLLTSFDETRTAASLSLLAAAGRARQIIVFTHHRHVAELAEAVDGHIVDVIRL